MRRAVTLYARFTSQKLSQQTSYFFFKWKISIRNRAEYSAPNNNVQKRTLLVWPFYAWQKYWVIKPRYKQLLYPQNSLFTNASTNEASTNIKCLASSWQNNKNPTQRPSIIYSNVLFFKHIQITVTLCQDLRAT